VLADALGALEAPAYMLDPDGVIRWQNRHSVEALGETLGTKFTRFIPPEQLHRVRNEFAKKVIGAVESTTQQLTAFSPKHGRVAIEVRSAPLRVDGRVVGILAIVWRYTPTSAETCSVAASLQLDRLTPRQHEVLRLLHRGASTREIATTLGIADETARNHIRSLLRKLGVHSRLEAVAVASEAGLL
jgi:DNA-binding CsgD family transcriptional regulator